MVPGTIFRCRERRSDKMFRGEDAISKGKFKTPWLEVRRYIFELGNPFYHGAIF